MNRRKNSRIDSANQKTTMKKHLLIAGRLALAFCLCWSVQAADPVTLISKPGSKMRLEGTSTIHDWQVESPFIGGFVEAGQNFPLEPGQAVTPGKIEAKVDMFINVRGLKSLEKDGRPYSDKMDDVMHKDLKVEKYPQIRFRLSELVLKEAAKSKDDPYLCDATGELAVAGVTNKTTMPIEITPLPDKKVKISGKTTLKITDFKMELPGLAFGIKTGDEVKVIFAWMLGQKIVPAAAAK
jgi:polyisoprenoid-binding protein YceI